jgi:hypothetical protein
VDEFLRKLHLIAPSVGGGAYAFMAGPGVCNGWVQIIVRSDVQIEIHRLWTLQPGKGNGAMMLRAVCALADQCGIEIKLKALPFGRKPYRLSADQLCAWYQKYGFEGTRRKMIRKPR